LVRLRFGEEVHRLRASDDFSPAFGVVIRRGLADPSAVDNYLTPAPDPSLSRQLERSMAAERIASEGRISKFQHEENEKLRAFEMRIKAELAELTNAITDEEQKTSLTQFASSRLHRGLGSGGSATGSPQGGGSGLHNLLSGVRSSPSGIALLPQLLPSSNASGNISPTQPSTTTNSDNTTSASSDPVDADPSDNDATSTHPTRGISSHAIGTSNIKGNGATSSSSSSVTAPPRRVLGPRGANTNQVPRPLSSNNDDDDDDGLFEFDEDSSSRVNTRTPRKYNDDEDDDDSNTNNGDDSADDVDEEPTDYKKGTLAFLHLPLLLVNLFAVHVIDFGALRSATIRSGLSTNMMAAGASGQVRRDYPLLSSSIPVEIPRFGHRPTTTAPPPTTVVVPVTPVATAPSNNEEPKRTLEAKLGITSPTLGPRPSPKMVWFTPDRATHPSAHPPFSYSCWWFVNDE
jgi:hypothetical protein